MARPGRNSLPGYFEHADIPESSEDLYGIYTAVSLPVDGKGYVVSDRFSLGILYVAESADALIVSTRASLAARAVTPPGAPPDRDIFGVSWLPATIQTRTLDTGYTDVKAIPPMAHVFLDPVNGARIVEHDRWYWQFPNQDEIPNTIDELVPMLEADLRKEMSALVELPASMRQIRLSGGKDSRLLASLTLLEGIARPVRVLDLRAARLGRDRGRRDGGQAVRIEPLPAGSEQLARRRLRPGRFRPMSFRRPAFCPPGTARAKSMSPHLWCLLAI